MMIFLLAIFGSDFIFAECAVPAPGTVPHINLFLPCEKAGAGCEEFKDLEGKSFWLATATKTGLSIVSAFTVHQDLRTEAASEFTLDKASICRNSEFTEKHKGHVVAMVGGGKIVSMPFIKESISTERVILAPSPNASYREVADMCLSVYPGCEVGPVGYLNFKESVSRSWKKFRDKLAGKDKSLFDAKED